MSSARGDLTTSDSTPGCAALARLARLLMRGGDLFDLDDDGSITVHPAETVDTGESDADDDGT